jgi:hypothetical protein
VFLKYWEEVGTYQAHERDRQQQQFYPLLVYFQDVARADVLQAVRMKSVESKGLSNYER